MASTDPKRHVFGLPSRLWRAFSDAMWPPGPQEPYRAAAIEPASLPYSALLGRCVLLAASAAVVAVCGLLGGPGWALAGGSALAIVFLSQR
jgi:hypothetical protein